MSQAMVSPMSQLLLLRLTPLEIVSGRPSGRQAKSDVPYNIIAVPAYGACHYRPTLGNECSPAALTIA
jgi:hypothetical protein